MSNDTINISGLDELDARLRELGTVTGAKALRSALLTTTTPLLRDIKASVPVNTGDLKKSIGRRTKIERKGFISEVARVQVGAVRKASWRAHFIEFGTLMRVRGKDGKLRRIRRDVTFVNATNIRFGTVRIKPNPFIRSSWERNKEQLLARFAVELRKKIEKAATR